MRMGDKEVKKKSGRDEGRAGGRVGRSEGVREEKGRGRGRDRGGVVTGGCIVRYQSRLYINSYHGRCHSATLPRPQPPPRCLTHYTRKVLY